MSFFFRQDYFDDNDFPQKEYPKASDPMPKGYHRRCSNCNTPLPPEAITGSCCHHCNATIQRPQVDGFAYMLQLIRENKNK